MITDEKTRTRLLVYASLAAAFRYPDDNFYALFPDEWAGAERLIESYDDLFRRKEIWLLCVEYTAENEFQRVQQLADINGFYRAFGVHVDQERSDAISCELEFMHYLIFKMETAPDEEKRQLCLQAQRDFFLVHLYPAATKLCVKVLATEKDTFYGRACQSLLDFFEEEKSRFEAMQPAATLDATLV